MAHSKSAKKRQRQNEARRLRNKHFRTRFRNVIKRFKGLLADGRIDEAQALFNTVVKTVDQTAAKGIIHKRAADRHKSRLSRLLHTAQQNS